MAQIAPRKLQVKDSFRRVGQVKSDADAAREAMDGGVLGFSSWFLAGFRRFLAGF